ncbi:MAG: DHH family phosphoesterase [Candidatus Bathyarchaeota archaeon]|nr:DHH family phosphoesterase [Candidatus Bathyarchaeota archaeon]
MSEGSKLPIQELTAILDQVNARLVLILGHHNADPDAIGAAFALSSLLQRLRPRLNTEVAAAEGPSRLSKHILTVTPVKLTKVPHIEEADSIILVDTNTIQQLGDWADRVKASRSPIIVIDHHARHPETERQAALCISDESVSSTCEIIYRFFMDMNVRFTESEAKLLFLGIAFDTRHFILANSTTLKIVADLIDSGVNAQEALSLLSLPMEESERIARLKASRRVKLLKIGGWIIAFSRVGAYQASAARALISLGAHVAIVAGQKEDKLRISMRASHDFYEATNMHLGRELAKPLGDYAKGMGGGHAIAAGVNGVWDLEACLKHSIRLLKQRLKERPIQS